MVGVEQVARRAEWQPLFVLVVRSSTSVIWRYLEGWENGKECIARLCTIVTHLERFCPGSLIVLTSRPMHVKDSSRYAHKAQCFGYAQIFSSVTRGLAQCSS